MTADEPPRGYCGKYCRLNLRAPGPHEAYCITFWGFVSALVFCASSIAVALFTGSPAEFAFAFETGVDAIATSIVLWRFSDAEADAAAAERTERIASLCVSYAIVFLGVTSIAFAMLAAGDADARHSYKSISHQAHEQEWREQEEEMGVQILLSVPSAMVGACLGALQLFLGGALGSPSLEKDAIITLFGSATCLVAWVGATVDVLTGGALWWLDEVGTIVLALILTAYGALSVADERCAYECARGCEALPCTRAVACLRPCCFRPRPGDASKETAPLKPPTV